MYCNNSTGRSGVDESATYNLSCSVSLFENGIFNIQMGGQSRSFTVDPTIMTYFRESNNNSDLVNKYSITLHGAENNQGRTEYYSVGIFIQLSRVIFVSFERSNDAYKSLDNFVCFFNNPSVANNVVDVTLEYASAEHIPAGIVGIHAGSTRAQVNGEYVDHPCTLQISNTGEFTLHAPVEATGEARIITSTGRLLGRPFDKVAKGQNYAIAAYVEGTNPKLANLELVIVHLDGSLRPESAGGVVRDETNHCRFSYGASPIIEVSIDYDRQLGQPEACEGNPCNVATGNKFQAESDYAAQNMGGLQFVRNYNSANGQWRNTYERIIIPENTGATDSEKKVAVIRDDGKVIRFREHSSNSYSAPPGINLALVRTNSSNGALTGWKLTTEIDAVELYDANGRLISITERNGLKKNLTYENIGTKTLLKSVQDAFGRRLTFTNDASGRLASMTDPAGNIFSYDYDDLGRLAQVTYPDAKVRTYIYNEPLMTSGIDSPLLLTGIIDENGSRFATWKYNENGKVILSEHAGGVERVSLNYIVDSEGNHSTEVTDTNGHTRVYNLIPVNGVLKVAGVSSICDGCIDDALNRLYDDKGNLVERVDRAGRRTTISFDERNLETSRNENDLRFTSTDWHDRFRLPTFIYTGDLEVAYEYDPIYGNLLKKTITDWANQTSRTWSYTYFTDTRLLKTINGPRTDLKDETTFSYDDEGNITSITNPLGHVTRFALYDKNGRPGSITSPNGLITLQTFDSRGRITTRKVGGELTTYRYNAVGLLRELTLPSGEVITYTYDEAHRLTKIQRSNGERITYVIDPSNNILKQEISATNGVVVSSETHEYDQYNRLRKIIQFDGSAISLETNENGYITGFTDPLARQTQLKLDDFDRVREVIYSEQTVQNREYDIYDQLTKVSNSKGVPVTYTVDALGDIKAIDTTDPDAYARTYTFDAAGNIKTKRDAYGSLTSYTYDALNRVTTISAAGTPTINFGYDGDVNGKGQLTSISDESGVTVRAYDSFGRIASVSRTFSGLDIKVKYTHDSAGRLTQVTYPSGTIVKYQYDKEQIVGVDVGSRPLLSEIKYQPFGGVKSWRWGSGADYTRTFDLAGNLLTYSFGGGIRTIERNTLGSIVSIQDNLDSTKLQKFSYDEFDRITNYWAGATLELQEHFEYDSVGNRINAIIGGRSFIYTYRSGTDFLDTVSGPVGKRWSWNADGSLLSDGNHTFKIDKLRRVAGVSSAGVTTDYLRNGLQERVTKRSTDGNVTHFAFDHAGHLIAELDQFGNTILEHVWLGDQPVGVVFRGDIYYVFADHLNTPRLITNTLGQARWTWDSNPFGSTPPNENPIGLGSFTYNGRFPGQYYDSESGLHANYFRDYDPQTGRYILSDPIGLDGGINTYAYVGSNPLSYSDPLGLQIAPPLNNLFPGAAAGSLSPASRTVEQAINGIKQRMRNNPKKTYQTYTRYNPRTGQCYSGRTSGKDSPSENVRRRSASEVHLTKEGFLDAVLDRSTDNYFSIRGREQQLISINGGAASTNGTSRNAINGIWEYNILREVYLNSAYQEWGEPISTGQCTCK